MGIDTMGIDHEAHSKKPRKTHKYASRLSLINPGINSLVEEVDQSTLKLSREEEDALTVSSARHRLVEVVTSFYMFATLIYSHFAVAVSTLAVSSVQFFSTYHPSQETFTYRLSWNIVSFAVVFPLTFSIGQAFRRREAANTDLTLISAHLMHIWLAHMTWDWGKTDAQLFLEHIYPKSKNSFFS
jgi:hypothetical protein